MSLGNHSLKHIAFLIGAGSVVVYWLWKQRKPSSKSMLVITKQQLEKELKELLEQQEQDKQAYSHQTYSNQEEAGIAQEQWELDMLTFYDEREMLLAQLDLVDQLQGGFEVVSREGLETVLQQCFKRYDHIQAEEAELPFFDDDDEGSTFDEQEKEQRQALEAEEYRLIAQIDLLCKLLGISERRNYEVKKIIRVQYGDEESREEGTTTCYPIIKRWMQGQEIPLQCLSIPAHVAGWLYP